MNQDIQSLLKELEAFGQSNDLAVQTRQQKMLNITPETGVFLSILIQSMHASRVLEVGTSNGYSTLWIADAVKKIGGLVTTIEMQEHKIEKARSNFIRAGLQEQIKQLRGDAGQFLNTFESCAFELIFLDSDREQYFDWWPSLIRTLVPGGILVVDNAISHKAEMTKFQTLIQSSGFIHSLLPIGNGELLVLKPL